MNFLHAKYVLGFIFLSVLVLHQPFIVKAEQFINGVEACENHCYDQHECDAVGNGSCCQWDDENEKCVSNIGQSICPRATAIIRPAAHLSQSSSSVACPQTTLITSLGVSSTTSRSLLSSDVESELAPPTSPPTKYNERRCDNMKSWLEIQQCLLGFSTTQITVKIIIGKISALLSISGSSYVIQDVIRDPDKRRESTYHRLMFGLSCSDILYSFIWFLGTWAMPKGSNLFAVGSNESCVAVGFIHYTSSLSTPLYNCSLATFYLMKLRFNWVKRKIKAVEKWLHILSWTVCLIVGIAAAASSTLGPYFNVCWLDQSSSPYANYFSIFSIVSYLCSLCYVSIVMFLVYRHVNNIEKEASKYSFAARHHSVVSNTNATVMKMSRRVMLQGILYGFLLLYPPVVLILITIRPPVFAFFLLGNIFFPLQGFFNALIYAIPVFKQMIKKSRKKSRRKQQEQQGIIMLMQGQQNTSKETLLMRWKLFWNQLLGSKGNGVEGGNSSDPNKSKSILCSSDSGQAGLKCGYNNQEVGAEASKYQSKRATFSKEIIHTEGNNNQNGYNSSLNFSSELLGIEEETKEEITRREDSKDTAASRGNMLQHVDEERTAPGKPLSHHFEVKDKKDESWQHYFTAFELDVDVFESVKNEDSEDIDDESYVDDYLRLMRIE